MSTELLEKKPSAATATRQEAFLRPAYEVQQHEEAYEIRVSLPGVPKDRATVTLEKGTLTVEGTRRNHAAEQWRPVHREIPTADYRLRLSLNLRVDEEKIAAESKDGVLIIRLPVADAAKPRSIQIQ